MNGSLFNIIFNALSPYLYDVLSLAFALTLFSHCFKLIRGRGGNMQGMGGSNPYQGMVAAAIGFGLGKGIPIIIKLTDTICNEILKKLG